jgi:hypothetical protein
MKRRFDITTAGFNVAVNKPQTPPEVFIYKMALGRGSHTTTTKIKMPNMTVLCHRIKAKL